MRTAPGGKTMEQATEYQCPDLCNSNGISAFRGATGPCPT
jgi:hypothetical protein